MHTQNLWKSTNFQEKSQKFCEQANYCLHLRINEIHLEIEQNSVLMKDDEFQLQKMNSRLHKVENYAAQTLFNQLVDQSRETDCKVFTFRRRCSRYD